MAIRILQDDNTTTPQKVQAALKYLLLMKERGVNLRVISLGVTGPDSHAEQRDTIAALGNLGVLVVAFGQAALDNDRNPGYPACYPLPNIIRVTGSDQADRLTALAGWGRTNIHLAAPSFGLWSTSGSSKPTNYALAGDSGRVWPSIGQVAGAAALLASAWPDATVEHIKSAILESVDLVPALTNKVATHGRLNIGRAMERLNAIMTPVAPNDPQFNQQWGLQTIGATKAWATSTGSTNVVVAVIHTGIRYDHEDLAANMWQNPGEIAGNQVDDDNNGYVDDVYGFNFGDHNSDPMDTGLFIGTPVAGVIGAVSDNGKGIAGINWSVRLMALRQVISDGTFTMPAVYEALNYVAMMKQRGVNIAVVYVGAVGLDEFDEAQNETLRRLDNLGILVVTFPYPSTDNDASPGYPACYPVPNIISVAGIEQSGQLTSRSGWGRTTVDLAAPSGFTPTTDGRGPDLYQVAAQTGAQYLGAAHVAGAAALLASAWPQASAAQIKTALLQSVDLVPALTNKVATHGVLNVGRAMDSLNAIMINSILIERTGSSIVLSWPTRLGAVLEQASSLPAAAESWTTVLGTMETNENNTRITLPIQNRIFFRLRHP